MVDLKRDVYADLMKWKREDSRHLLELRGARQVGKTYILDKFARENYEIYLYINMAQTTGKEFLECLTAGFRIQRVRLSWWMKYRNRLKSIH